MQTERMNEHGTIKLEKKKSKNSQGDPMLWVQIWVTTWTFTLTLEYMIS